VGVSGTFAAVVLGSTTLQKQCKGSRVALVLGLGQAGLSMRSGISAERH